MWYFTVCLIYNLYDNIPAYSTKKCVHITVIWYTVCSCTFRTIFMNALHY